MVRDTGIEAVTQRSFWRAGTVPKVSVRESAQKRDKLDHPRGNKGPSAPRRDDDAFFPKTQ